MRSRVRIQKRLKKEMEERQRRMKPQQKKWNNQIRLL